jgi:hypothetical protein
MREIRPSCSQYVVWLVTSVVSWVTTPVWVLFHCQLSALSAASKVAVLSPICARKIAATGEDSVVARATLAPVSPTNRAAPSRTIQQWARIGSTQKQSRDQAPSGLFLRGPAAPC